MGRGASVGVRIQRFRNRLVERKNSPARIGSRSDGPGCPFRDLPFNGARDESPASKGARFILAKPPGVNVCARGSLRGAPYPPLDMNPPRAAGPYGEG